MRVRVLGGLSVDGVAEHDLGSRKGRTVLKVLALARGAPVTVDRIAEVVWGDHPPARVPDQVGVLVSRLRGVVGAERLPRTDAGYALVTDWLDVDELAARTAEAVAALGAGRHAAARAAAEAALALARGPVLPDEDGPWLEADRAVADRAVAGAGLVAAVAALAAGDADGAVVAATAALGRDPFDEAALRALMRAHAAAGRPASALAAYAGARARLAEELGVSPTAATEALHDAILLADDEPAGGMAPAPAITVAPAILGRDPELAALAAELDAVRAGGSRVTLVVGEAGIGKSALVRTFAGRAAAGGALVLRGRCDELGRDLPLQPVVDAVAAAAGTGSVDADGPAAALAAMLGGRPGSVSTTVLADGDTGRAALFAALLGAVADLAAGRPAVLVIEDLHLAAESTLGWLAFAQRRGHCLLVVATHRPPAIDLAGAVRLPLGPLGLQDAAALAGTDDADVLGRGAGNPLFLLALADAAPGRLPDSVRDAAEAQATALGSAAITVRTAACLGEEVDLDLLAEVLGPPSEVLGDLEGAAAAGLLDERGAGYAFHHALVRESLEGAAGVARRALVHREAARVLDGRSPPDPLAVAVHARLGGATSLAVDAYVRAAAVASARFDAAAAMALLEAALALEPSAAALTARARLRMSTLDYQLAADDAAAAVALGGDAAALEIAAWVAYYQRRYDDARLTADEGVARAGNEIAVRASCLAVAGRVRHGRGDLTGAIERFEAERSAPAAVQGVLDVWLAHARVHEGRPGEALSTVDRALLDGDHLAHPWAALHGRFARIMALGHLGRLADALRACDDIDASVERAGVMGSRFVAVGANLRGWLLRAAGRWDEAADHNHAARERAGGPDARWPSSEATAEGFWVAHLDLADGFVLAGDVERAAEWVDRCAPIDAWEGTMAWHQRHRLDLLRARLALLDGDPDRAAALAAGVATDAAARGAGRYHLLASGWLVLAGGEGDRARVAAVIDGLAGCAAIEGWRLVVALADRFAVDAWRAEAERRATTLIAAAGPLAESLRAEVAAVFG